MRLHVALFWSLCLAPVRSPAPVATFRDVPCDRTERLHELLHAAWVAGDAGFSADVGGRFAPNGVLIAPGPLTTRGPEHVAAYLSGDSLNPTSRARFVTVGGDLARDGRDGFTYGYLDAVRPNGNTTLAWYHAYWRRTAAGEWRILAMSRRRRAKGAEDVAWAPRALTPVDCGVKSGADTLALLETVKATDRAFSDSAARNLGAAFAFFGTDDVAKSGAGSTYVHGRAAVEALFASPPPNGIAWAPLEGTVAASGDLAFTIGTAGPRTTRADAPPPNPATVGHYFTIWRRQPDGSWRYAVD